jgi:hypothetical protein
VQRLSPRPLLPTVAANDDVSDSEQSSAAPPGKKCSALCTAEDSRKNWLFAGSFEGARRAAVLYSLVQSCKLIDVAPFDYLKDVLLRVATHPHRLIAQLTPRGWRETFCAEAGS